MDQAEQILKKYWGYNSFRPVQHDIIDQVFLGKDALALLPTGGGKSICFQVPAVMLEGICLVVSPLIALMKDQVDQLKKRNIKADAIYSGMHYREIERILDNAILGDTKLLYLSPERLSSEKTMDKISQMNVSFVAVDEAHCVSQWGHDFRPTYHNISAIRLVFPKIPILAVTATATKDVVKDIILQLGLKDPKVFKSGFTRPNLSYSVIREEGKHVRLLQMIQKVQGTGLVYVRNRKLTKEIALFLQQKGISADNYHAGLASDERFLKQENWIKNKTRIIVCTNAFGMGIDKPDVRLVVHMDVPETLEAYFQEAGRAGRDGKQAWAILLFNENDIVSLEKNFELSYPSIEKIRNIYHALGSYFQLATGAGEGIAFDFDMVEFCKNFKQEPLTVLSALKVMERSGQIFLSEAIFDPPKIMIGVDRNELYQFQLQNPAYEKLITIILRLHQGIFRQAVRLEDYKICSLLKLDASVLTKMLFHLQQIGLIQFYPRKEMPQIIFLSHRVEAKYLVIDREKYKFLKDRARDKMNAVINYLLKPICRNEQLLEYFDEKSVSVCGICDVCVTKKRREEAQKYESEMTVKLIELIKSKTISLQELIASFPVKHKDKLIELIQFLINEKRIKMTSGDKIEWIA